MLFTTSDPRTLWRAFIDGAPGVDQTQLRALPAGAREVPLDWVCTTQVERRGHFDKDAQGEVFYDFRTVSGWRAEPDPRVHLAGALSFHGLEVIATGLFSEFPGPERLGASLSALTLEGHLLTPTALEWIGRARAWTDLSIWCARWSPASRAAGLRELAANFPALLGLELHTANLDAEGLGAVARAPFLERLEDLTLANRPLDPVSARALAQRLGHLIHLDLKDANLGPKFFSVVAPRLTRARRLNLSNNPMGDAGFRSLLDAHAFDSVEDLWLSRCELTDVSARALAEASPPRLRSLWIDSNHLTDDGLEALVRSPLFARLEGVYLWQRGLTERSTQLLAGHALASGLTGTARLPGVTAMWFMGR